MRIDVQGVPTELLENRSSSPGDGLKESSVDAKRPKMNLANEGRRVLNRIRIDDPTGQFADDAAFALGKSFLKNHILADGLKDSWKRNEELNFEKSFKQKRRPRANSKSKKVC